MRAVVLGAGGMLGKDLIAETPPEVEAVGCTRADVDMRDADAVSRVLDEARPDWVVNAAAYTDVDGAEADPDTAFAVNSVAVGELGRLCRARNCVLLHYSTDYVFDGRKDGFYAEDDPPNPVNRYAASKLAGEERLRASGCAFLLIRSQWLFGHTGKSFVSRIATRARRREPTRAADDQFGCATYTVDLAAASWALLSQGRRGTFHVANRGCVNRYELARFVFQQLGVPHLVEPARASEFPAAAPRPARTPLDVRKAEAALGYRLPAWDQALTRYLRTMEGYRVEPS